MNEQGITALQALPRVELARYPTPIEPLARFGAAIGAPRLLVKRDDAIAFAFGGNKVRKIELVAAEAVAEGADTLITAGGVQSNHARVAAAAAARLGLECVLVANGPPPARPTANALLDRLLGAQVHYVGSRDARAPAMHELAARLLRQGRRPFVIPIGASTATGALAYVRAVGELLEQGVRPDAIVVATSSGGTQAGIVAGCRLLGLEARVIGVSADDPAREIGYAVAALIRAIEPRLGLPDGSLTGAPEIEVDDTFVGAGYGVPTPESQEAIELAARTEALFLDPTYTAKAMAGLLAYVRQQRLPPAATILFWHTGGQVTLFA